MVGNFDQKCCQIGVRLHVLKNKQEKEKMSVLMHLHIILKEVDTYHRHYSMAFLVLSVLRLFKIVF